MKQKTALIAGATGLVGGELLKILLDSDEYSMVTVIVRRTLGISNPKLIERVIDFDTLKQYPEIFAVDDVFCCLGTTIKKAKSRPAFEWVDYIYPVELAEASKAAGAKKFVLISSIGADPDSRIFYTRVKGRLEKRLAQIGFEELSIFQPSLLLGRRTEIRRGEKAAALLAKGMRFLFKGPLKKFTPVEARFVALAMFQAAQLTRPGVQYYRYNEIILAAYAKMF